MSLAVKYRNPTPDDAHQATLTKRDQSADRTTLATMTSTALPPAATSSYARAQSTKQADPRRWANGTPTTAHQHALRL